MSPQPSSWFYARTGKRCFDLAIAVPLLAFSLPVLGGIALVVTVTMGWPPWFRQLRGGLAGQPFWLLKFRSMTSAVDAQGKLLPDAQRLTRLGQWLRKTSLDELPQLWNVIRGDMSLVGPRPLLHRYVERYSPTQARRLDVRPGITGWSQINGRNALSWEEKFELDVWYVDHLCWRLDLTILAATVGRLMRPRGISADGEATMKEFMGTGPDKR
ncbi:MAG: sugar transferase [Pirellulaceae bacterium]|nr:sugar transferase [Planctomycetales bacterium]